MTISVLMSTGTADLGSHFQQYHVMVLSEKTEKSLSFEQHHRPQDDRLNEFAKAGGGFSPCSFTASILDHRDTSEEMKT